MVMKISIQIAMPIDRNVKADQNVNLNCDVNSNGHANSDRAVTSDSHANTTACVAFHMLSGLRRHA